MVTDTRRSRRAPRVAWPVIAAVTFLGSVVWASTQVGIAGVGLGLALSAVIVTLIVLAFLWLNRWHRARGRLFLSAFVWGASVAAFCSIWSQQWLQALIDATWGSDVGAWARPLIVTPVTEEVFKGLFLVWLLIYRRREITGVLDAIVFAGIVGAGFSFIENSLYLGGPLINVLQPDGGEGSAVATLGVTLFMRILMLPFFHSLMVTLTGVGIGIAANRRSPGAAIPPVIIGLLAAVVLHGTWDWAGLASDDKLLIFKIYASVMLPVFVTMFIVSVVLRRRQRRMIVAGMPALVDNGDIAASEANLLASLSARRRWRADARRSGGRLAARVTARYQAEASALAIRLFRARAADREMIHEQRRVLSALRISIEELSRTAVASR